MARKVVQNQNRTGIYLNGSDSYITLPSNYIIPQTFSIMFWYKPISITASDRIIDQQDAGPTNGFTFNLATTGSPQVSFGTRNVGTNEGNIISTSMRLAEWNFVTATFTTNSQILYNNTIQTGTPDVSVTMTAPTTGMYIGRRATASSNFCKGYIDNFAVFSKVLSATEMSNLFNGYNTPTDIGSCDVWYKFDELSGTTITDSSGNGRDGTRNGSATANPTVWFTEPGVRIPVSNGSSSKALNFAKLTTALISVADTSSLRPETTNLFTLGAWVYLFDTRENVLPRLWEKGAQFWCFMGDQTNGKGNQLAIEIANTDNSTTEYWGSTKLQPNRWYYISSTFDGSSTGVCQHYINGEKDAMQTLLGPFAQIKSTSGSTFNIGNNHSNTRNLSGMIKNFRFHNVILTQDEIKQNMRTNDVTRGIVGKWNIDEGSGSTASDSSGNFFTGTITGATWETV